MATLYKMTLYVCDLEDNLNLEQIKDLIDYSALEGVSVNCITHYANEQVGPEIEWNDDIDINNYNSTTEQWDKYFNR